MDVSINRPRMVYSLTTIPPRLKGFEKTVCQVINKLKYCDAMYLNIPPISCRGKAYEIPPDFLSSLQPHLRQKVIINRECMDEGPITKIFPALQREQDNGTLIISMDDDIRLKQDISEVLLKKHREYPYACLSFSGFCVGTFPFNWQFAISNKRDLECDWIQGVHCILYPRGLINYPLFREWNPHMFKHDDHRISTFLSSQGIPRISISENPIYYLYNDQELAQTAAISGSQEFIIQNAKICYTMKRQGIYGKSHPSLWLYSILGLIVFAVVLAILFSYSANYIDKYHHWFILLYGIIILALVASILTTVMLI